MILRDELSNGLSSIKAEDKIIEYESVSSGLIDDNFLYGLSFLNIHGVNYED